jgi:large subunit ribosomal protein L25
MTTQATISATSRAGTGKGGARSLRRAGKIPVVIYGRGRQAEALAVDSSALTRLLAQIAAATTIFDVAVEGRAPVKALIREIQRNPVRPGDIIHLDLYEVQADQQVTIEVPVKLIGTPDGVKNHGGVLDQIMHDIQIKVLPGDIPEHIDVDVSALAIGQSIHVADLGAGTKYEIMSDPRRTLCTVVAPRAEEVVAPVVEAVAPVEPELIRKAKPEDEAEVEGKE